MSGFRPTSGFHPATLVTEYDQERDPARGSSTRRRDAPPRSRGRDGVRGLALLSGEASAGGDTTAAARSEERDGSPSDPRRAAAAVAQWRSAAVGYGRLGTVAATGERTSPAGARRVRAAWAALRDLAGWRVRQLNYSADLFSGFLHGGLMADGAKEGLARMTAVELELRAKLRAALARVAA